MPRPFVWTLAAVAGLVMLLAGLTLVILLLKADRPEGALDTTLTDVTVSEAKPLPPPPK